MTRRPGGKDAFRNGYGSGDSRDRPRVGEVGALSGAHNVCSSIHLMIGPTAPVDLPNKEGLPGTGTPPERDWPRVTPAYLPFVGTFLVPDD
jgi:hypothetical protein